MLQIARRKPPFGIAQIGKSFRNEITPGNFLFRLREFEQGDGVFRAADEAETWYRFWIDARYRWVLDSACGSRTCASACTARRSAPTTPARTTDLEYLYPIGWSELEGIATAATTT